MWDSGIMLKKLYRASSSSYNMNSAIPYTVQYTPPYVTIATPFQLQEMDQNNVHLVFFGLNWPRSAPMSLDYRKDRSNLSLTYFKKYEKVHNKCIVMYIENIKIINIEIIQHWIDKNKEFDIVIFSNINFELDGVNVISTKVLFDEYSNLDKLLTNFENKTQDTIYARIDMAKHLTFMWCLDQGYEFVFYTDYEKIIPETIPEFAFECCKKCGILYTIYNMSGACEDHVYLIHNSAKDAVNNAFKILLKHIGNPSVNILQFIMNYKLMIRVFQTYGEHIEVPENIYLIQDNKNYEKEIEYILTELEKITLPIIIEDKFLKKNIIKIKRFLKAS